MQGWLEDVVSRVVDEARRVMAHSRRWARYQATAAACADAVVLRLAAARSQQETSDAINGDTSATMYAYEHALFAMSDAFNNDICEVCESEITFCDCTKPCLVCGKEVPARDWLIMKVGSWLPPCYCRATMLRVNAAPA